MSSDDQKKHTAVFSRNPQAPNPKILLLLVNFKRFNKRNGLHRAKVMFKDPLFTEGFFFLQTHVLISKQIRSMGQGNWDRASVHVLMIIFVNIRHQLCSPQCPQISVSRNTRTASTPSLSQITHLYKEWENFLLLTWDQTLFTGGFLRAHRPLFSLLSFKCSVFPSEHLRRRSQEL